MTYIGNFAEDSVIAIPPFHTNDGSGGLVAPSSALEAADVKIFKDGSDVEKTSTNGLTMTSPFTGTVGQHRLIVDTSNDTGDAGWWVAGSDYSVVLNPDETVDSQTVGATLATFGIQNRYQMPAIDYRLGAVVSYDGTTLKVALWGEENGVLQTDYISATDVELWRADTDAQIADLGNDTSDSTNGVFHVAKAVALADWPVNVDCYIMATLTDDASTARTALSGVVRVLTS